MKLYIPNIGDNLKLIKEWEFQLHSEYRNFDTIKFFHNVTSNYRDTQSYKTILPIDTILIIDRIYIRKGADDFSSVTFKYTLPTGESGRFWAKLNDVNNIEFTQLEIINLKDELNKSIEDLENNFLNYACDSIVKKVKVGRGQEEHNIKVKKTFNNNIKFEALFTVKIFNNIHDINTISVKYKVDFNNIEINKKQSKTISKMYGSYRDNFQRQLEIYNELDRRS